MNKSSSRIIHTESERDSAADAIRKLSVDKPLRITIERYKPKRSLAQNRLYWKWMEVLGIHFGYSREEMHEELARLFIGEREYRGIDGILRVRRESTTKLNTAAFTDYLNNIDRWAISEYSVVLPKPEDLYNEAMGIS